MAMLHALTATPIRRPRPHSATLQERVVSGRPRGSRRTRAPPLRLDDVCAGRERLALEELAQHVERRLGLVHRHEVARVAQLHEREAAVALEAAGVGAADDVARVLGSEEAGVARPLERARPRLPAEPVDDEVVLSKVGQHRHAALEQARHGRREALHPVAGEHELDLDGAVAARPRLFVRAERREVGRVVEPVGRRREVIAERRHLARQPHVVQVELARLLRRDELREVAKVVGVRAREVLEQRLGARHARLVAAARQALGVVLGRRAAAARRVRRVAVLARRVGAVARGGERQADGEASLHDADLRVRQLHLRLVLARERRVRRVLVDGVDEAVADHHAAQVDRRRGGGVVLLDELREGGRVVAAVALGGDEEGLLGVLGVGREPILEELEHVGRHLLLVGHTDVERVGVIREARADGLVDEEDVGLLVPRVRIEAQRAVRVNLVRPVLDHQREHAAAPRPARHPQDERIVGGIAARLEEPVEEVARAVDRHIAGKVVDRLRADALRAASDVRRGGGQRGEQREREHPASRVTAK
mmetsp:Transcript_6707/g.17530  ORF Transcript_6707/g.17530 Transcript_6707/m.17530 type:complete len:537 (-) Transcript_6707:67-1677(-)